MWIRSQDMKTLVNASEFRIYEERKEFSICSRIELLGKYSTEEKAMKVMNAIQYKICFGTKSYHPVEPVTVNNGFTPYKIEREHVFQMPKDDEVDV